MKIFQAFSAIVLIRGVAAGSFPMMSPVPKPPFKNETEHATAKTFVTTITSDYSFYCPEPSTFHHKNVTYTATEPTYLTITNCPCTVTYTQNIKSPGTAVYPTAPPGQPMPPTPPAMSSSAPAPPLPPDKPAPPPSEYSALISGPPPPPPKATAPYSEPSLPPAIPKSGTVPIPEAPPPPPPPPPPHATAPAPAPEPSPPKATVPAAGTLPPPPPPEVSVPAPELPPPPPPSNLERPAVPPSQAASPPANPTGTIEASVSSAAANKVSGSFGAFVFAGVAALAM
ncbi:hypothetical protein NOF04DRAFT_20482 [Fusarium oxysporum II5]|uniref:Cell wall protein SED1 n=2 Tax=Fusarium oxysporum f. sp. cubense (strain race 4) TaxID=2502994 RepID=N1REF2_FUSC4|nr:uncharacterized protein FOIG_05763 [Fusarium odoratissimum NRRL 54006]EMT63890.1 Cell wall protein SED1 [Fusarium odoratissimum]EMT63891.1 Cell wall protein SED1 [Fusarium odoratissimum]EXM04327.1 hypothetical protein FOIG_05763 [Fusarium odoratissimum NRRL 54006]KAK2131553.1 hypothetical protein NOF04DRAFT_20482 [Fusarium oxysporum II5]